MVRMANDYTLDVTKPVLMSQIVAWIDERLGEPVPTRVKEVGSDRTEELIRLFNSHKKCTFVMTPDKAGFLIFLSTFGKDYAAKKENFQHLFQMLLYPEAYWDDIKLNLQTGEGLFTADREEDFKKIRDTFGFEGAFPND